MVTFGILPGQNGIDDRRRYPSPGGRGTKGEGDPASPGRIDKHPQRTKALPDVNDLDAISRQITFKLIELSHRARAPHLAPSMSIVDALVALYWEVLNVGPENIADPARDRFILSKGHAALGLYGALGVRGIISMEQLATFGQPGSDLPEQPAPGAVPGVEWATGSLGHGLGVGLGMALAAKRAGSGSKVAVLMGDGECNEGSVWEAAMLAPQLGLSNLLALIDFNKWQATARSREVMQLDPLADKWRAFGWRAEEVDGHDIGSIAAAAKRCYAGDGPGAIVLNTIKGKGVSFMEDDNNWHYIVPNEEHVSRAREELLGTP